MVKSKKKGSDVSKKSNRITGEIKFLAFLGIFLPLLGYFINLIIKSDNKYVMHYSNQGLILFFFGLLLTLAAKIIISLVIPLTLINDIVWILLLVIWVIGWINALSGEMRSTLIIGDLAKKFNMR